MVGAELVDLEGQFGDALFACGGQLDAVEMLLVGRVRRHSLDELGPGVFLAPSGAVIQPMLPCAWGS